MNFDNKGFLLFYVLFVGFLVVTSLLIGRMRNMTGFKESYMGTYSQTPDNLSECCSRGNHCCYDHTRKCLELNNMTYEETGCGCRHCVCYKIWESNEEGGIEE